MSSVLIIGAGRIGKAISHELERVGHSMALWDALPGLVTDQQPLEALAPNVNALILCVPSWSIADAVAPIRDLLPSDALVLTLAKGLVENKTMNVLIAELFPQHPTGVVAGPMMAEEIEKGMGGIAVIGSASAVTRSQSENLFRNTNIRIESTTDARGAALAGVLKNIYACGLGIADAIGWGLNWKGWYVARAFHEIVLLGTQQGGREETFHGPAGLGDFLATAFSPHSRNRTTGEEILRTGVCTKDSESIKSLGGVMSIAGSQIASLPLLRALHDILIDHQDARKIYAALVD